MSTLLPQLPCLSGLSAETSLTGRLMCTHVADCFPLCLPHRKTRSPPDLRDATSSQLLHSYCFVWLGSPRRGRSDYICVHGGINIWAKKAVDHICHSLLASRELEGIFKNVCSSKYVGQRRQAERLFRGMLHLARWVRISQFSLWSRR